MLIFSGWDIVAAIISCIGLIVSHKKREYISAGGFAVCATTFLIIIISSPESYF